MPVYPCLAAPDTPSNRCLGPRIIKNLMAQDFTIKNRKFEATLGVKRDSISDDKLGLFKPMFAEMGQGARRHPEELVFGLLKSGFTSACYDGQNSLTPITL